LITRGILKPKQTLSDIKIATALNISKSPVRESFKRLEQDELIKIMPQSKTFILPINQEKIDGACKLREAIELLLVSEAVEYVTEEDLLILDSLVDKQQQAVDRNDKDEYHQYDVAFHHKIAKISKLLDAWNILEKVNIYMNRIRYLSTDRDSLIGLSIKEHRKIVVAMKEKSKTKAKREMSSHLTRTRKALKKLF